ncbi:PQQ-dependent sugar dehydrogenase [Humisphaera borealis]|uniref:PQQ-dependent sugar dehydrogenase n=1 Tax=Humisphaera borealis TaxID=2807512 RepID=A0A7M2X1D4_9BACT|nr:PQQ-dependent sugar dehydrogenase [Humisphaera borealis]QOV91513.1 PQQ-dependent sugar dehydrogenase [Humisphaera borealis]
MSHFATGAQTGHKVVESLEPRRLFAAAAGFADTLFATGLSQPTAFAFAPDGRLFVAQQGGALRVIKDGATLADPALLLDVDSQGERGLIGVALDPSFSQNGLIYLHYTTETPTVHNRVSRFTVAGDTVEPASEQVLIDLPTLSGATNHNGGAIHFGTDGKLYIGVGDNADPANAQPLDSLLGKILRLNADGSIPDDNPFRALQGAQEAIWARGLRNPYTFAVRSDGRIHINDVGQSSFEEINLGVAGGNYGWPITEGKRGAGQDVPDGYVDPLFAYDRSGGPVSGPSIAGGAFYEPPITATVSFPASMTGDYLFADWGSGFVKSFDIATRKVSPVASGLSGPLDIAVGPDGAAYVLEYHAGQVTRIAASPPDLAIALTQGPSSTSPIQLDRDVVKVRVENAGTVAVNERLTVRLRLTDPSGIEPPSDVLAQTTRRFALKPGGGVNLNLRYAYPLAVAGERTVEIELLGVTGDAADANTVNNLATAGPLQIAAATVDLSPAFRQQSVTAAAGARLPALTLDLRNLGTVAFSGRAEVAFSITPQGGGEATPIKTVATRKVIPGQSDKPLRVRLQLPAGLASGVYELSAKVTAAEPGIGEDLSNDSAGIPVTIN